MLCVRNRLGISFWVVLVTNGVASDADLVLLAGTWQEAAPIAFSLICSWSQCAGTRPVCSWAPRLPDSLQEGRKGKINLTLPYASVLINQINIERSNISRRRREYLLSES